MNSELRNSKFYEMVMFSWQLWQPTRHAWTPVLLPETQQELKAIPNSVNFDIKLTPEAYNGFLCHFGVIPRAKKLIVNNLLTIQYITKQYRFPKSKKVRIRKKWRKNPDNFRTERHDTAFESGDMIIVSQKIYDILIERMQNDKNQDRVG